MTDHTRIDRRSVVRRHTVTRDDLDWDTPLQLGNGHFSFSADATGLQTFVPFNTMADWGWHSSPLPPGSAVSDYREPRVDVGGAAVPFPLPDPAHPVQSGWLFANPSRVNLGRIGLGLADEGGGALHPASMSDVHQELDLWNGLLTSAFTIAGEAVEVTTAVAGTSDTVACSIRSELVRRGQLRIVWDFPYADSRSFAHYVGDWGRPGQHATTLDSRETTAATLRRSMDDLEYFVDISWAGAAELARSPGRGVTPVRVIHAEYYSNDTTCDVTADIRRLSQFGTLRTVVSGRIGEDRFARTYGADGVLAIEYELHNERRRELFGFGSEVSLGTGTHAHEFTLTPSGTSDSIEVVTTYRQGERGDGDNSVTRVMESSSGQWNRHWSSGGFIDLASQTDDRRAHELERRTVHSIYLMAINAGGSLPPQESGLVNNGWHGKFHLEMYPWHIAHWMLWGRPDLARRSLPVYDRLLPAARDYAARQGFAGARWPKMVGPNGRESPHEIHAYLLWQQPNPIFLAELEYSIDPSREVLERWREVVESTADFLASFPRENPASGYLDLGAPLHIVAETTDPHATSNGVFELAYWRFGLRVAAQWRARLGLDDVEAWRNTHDRLAPLPQDDGAYSMFAEASGDWAAWAHGHPAAAGTYGLLPGDGVEPEIARRTFERILRTWNFQETWGWDFPMLAMSAARLGDPQRAIELLLIDNANFAFDASGAATGGPYPYFPSNGSFLYAMGMLAVGWSGETGSGFPAQWRAVSEGISAAL